MDITQHQLGVDALRLTQRILSDHVNVSCEFGGRWQARHGAMFTSLSRWTVVFSISWCGFLSEFVKNPINVLLVRVDMPVESVQQGAGMQTYRLLLLALDVHSRASAVKCCLLQ